MRLTEAGLVSKRSAKFSQSCISRTVSTAGGSECPEKCLGGIIKRGQLGWLAQGPLLEVHSLRSGQKISSFHFDINLGFENCIITSVAEVEGSELNCCLLAIGILFGDSPGSVVALYSVKESKVVRCIEIKEKVTCCAFIGPDICKRTVLHMLQGCLAVGTETGKIFLLDTNLAKCEEALLSTRQTEEDIELVPCHTVSSTLEFTHIRQHHKHSKQENVNFGIELERIESAGLILSMVSFTPLLALAVGLEDGRMILYDLSELQPFYISYPPEKVSPLVKIAFMEPPDDPRACIYLWAYHEHAQTAFAVMHSLMYDKKMTEDDGVCLYEGFQSSKVRLTLPMYEQGSLPVTCRTISKYSSNDDDEILSLCLFAWKTRKLSHIILFDISQWYKEEMPTIGDWRENLNYLAHFQLKDQSALDVYIDPSTVASFNSIQRPEEHFYPISLCFDCIVVETSGSVQFHWPGLQNRALELLSSGGPTAILDPSYYFNEVMGASLMPQFSDHGYNSSFSINIQREILLSIALEYNCFGILKECAKCWADGSCLGRKPYEGLSLSTLTEWIWNRAGKIKNRSNILCATLFDHSGIHMDQRSQKELSCLCRQLKLLADLYDVVLTKCKEYIPETELDTLSIQYNSIRTAAEYQEVLQWLLNIGLLPEGHNESEDDKTYSRTPLVPYPYKVLKSYYMNQRARFGKLNKGFISSRTQSCRILYIDSFIEHECNASVLRDHWVESGGNGLYPPPSLQAMLRTLLVPDVPIENKYVLFIYLFLDLNMAIEDESCSPIVQNLIKFPAVFKMNASLIKTVQAFWNLDHSQFEVALEEIISPFSQDRKLLQWQQELLIEALLAQDQPNLALQALQARISPISSLLELKTLLANDLVAEAYHLQKSKNDPELLRTFLNGCLYLGKWGILRDLALTEEEGKIVEDFLRETKSANAENLHFVYLLQRSKYVEAISYLDELSKNKQNQRTVDLETPNLVLSAYNLTMTPAVKKVSNIYCNIRGRIKPLKTGASHPMPFSCELLKHGIRDMTGGIYHSSALSTDQASIYWDDGIQKESNRLLDANNVPFIRQPQLDVGDLTVRESLSYPEVYKAASKRRLNDSSDLDVEIEDPANNPPKRQKVVEGTDFARSKKSFHTLNTSLLTRFKTKSLKDSTAQENSLSVTCSRQESKEKSVLSTPFVKSRRVDFKDELDTIDNNAYERVCTPHSILKVKSMLRTSSPSPTPFKTREQRKSASKDTGLAANTTAQKRSEIANEEKFIRFDLPRRSDITVSSVEVSPIVKSNDTSLILYGPQRRKSIRSIETSAVSISDADEFFSPIQSQDTSKVDEEMDVDSDTIERSREVQEEEEYEEIETQNNHENEIAPPSRQAENTGPNKIMSIESNKSEKITMKTSLPRQRFNVTDGPKARRPLRRSDSPIEEEFLKKISDRRTRSRSRSKTPDILSSPSRRSSRLAEKVDRAIGSRKPLSRMVLEANIEKTTTTTVGTMKETENSEIQSTRVSRVDIETSQTFETKYNEKTVQAKSVEFAPKFTSSFLKNHPWQNKVDDLSTPTEDDAINAGEIKNTIMAPTAVPVDDSILGESSQNRDYHLMTTMEISSFGDVTLEEFEPPGNLLSDSESGDSKNAKDNNNKIEATEEAGQNEGRKQEDKKEESSAEISTRTSEDRKKNEDGKGDCKSSECNEKNKNEEENGKNSAENEEESGKSQVYYHESQEGWPYEKDLDAYFEDEECINDDPEPATAEELAEVEAEYKAQQALWEDPYQDQSTPSWCKEKQSEEESEEDLSIDYSLKSSNSEVDDDEEEGVYDKDIVINISSTTDEDSSDSVEMSSPDKKSTSNKNRTSKEESVQDLDSFKDEENNVSDLLYGDIDKNESVIEEVDKDENDDLNNAVIFEKTSPSKPSSEKTKIASSSTAVNEKQDVKIIEKTGKEGQKEEKIEKLGTKPLQISSVRSIGEGMTLNFLTGEEEIIDDGANLHGASKKSGFVEIILSEITPKKPSSKATEYDSEGSVEVNEDPLDLTNSNSVVTNEPLNTKSIEANVPQNKVEIIEEGKAEDVKFNESPKKVISHVPILIVSPPEDSNDNTVANTLHTEKEINEQSKQMETPKKEDGAKNKSATESVLREEETPIGNNSKNTDTEVLEQVLENKIQTNIDSDRHEFSLKRDQPSTSSSIREHETDRDEAGTSVNSRKRDQPSTSSSIRKLGTDEEKEETIEIFKSTVPDVGSDENNIKLLVSDEDDQGGSENKNKELKSLTNSGTPVRNISVVEPTTPNSHRVLRNRRARSESIEIESDLISSDVRTPEKFQRGKSVPRTEVVGTPKSKIRRLSESSSYLSPSRILTRRQSQLLERIEEDNSLDSPAKHTRSRQRLNSNDSDQAPSTPNMNNNKRTRRSSISSTGTPIPTTPRNLRGSSVLSEENVPSTPRRSLKRLSLSRENLSLEESKPTNKLKKSANKSLEDEEETTDEEISNAFNEKDDKTRSKSSKPAKGNKRGNSRQDQENFEQKPEGTKVKTAKKRERTPKKHVDTPMEVDSSSSDEVASQKSTESVKLSKSVNKSSSRKTSKNKEDNEDKVAEAASTILLTEDLSASRRLTRNQLSILEKGLSSPITKIEPKKMSRRRSSNAEADSNLKKADNESEVESIASNRSRRSSIDSKKRTTRSSVKEQQDDDASSIASSSISKRSTQSKKASGRSSKMKSLKSIPEEDLNKSVSSDDETEQSPKEIPKKRGRPKKSIK